MSIARERSRPALTKHIEFHIDEVAFLSPAGCAAKSPRAYIRVRLSDRPHRLKTGMHLFDTSWQENLAPMALNETSQVTFELRCRLAWWRSGPSQLAVTRSYPLSKLLEMQGSGANIILPLCVAQSDSAEPIAKIGTLTMTVRVLSVLEAAKLFLESAEHSVREFTTRTKTLSVKHAARYKAGYDVLKPICGILDIVGPLIAFSPEPICAAVVGVVRGAAKSVKEQIEQDADVLTLMGKIQDIYDTVAGMSFVHKNENQTVLETALRNIVTTIGDCTQFIDGFCCKSTFLGRVARTPEKAKQLEGLQERLRRSKIDLIQAGQFERMYSQEETGREVKKLKLDEVLASLQRVHMGTGGLRRCKPNEHAETLSHIKVWVRSELCDGKNVLWLRGPAGCGKSTVAATLFDELVEADQLGGNFFFEERPKAQGTPDPRAKWGYAPKPEPAVVPKRDPAFVIQTLAGQFAVADRYGPLTHEIAARIRADVPRDLLLQPLDVQFEQLLLAPLQAHPPPRPLVFILDGFEWCGDGCDEAMALEAQDTLQRALKVLVEGSARFPANVRLLICSGESERVREVLRGCERVVQYEMKASELAVNRRYGWRSAKV
ncbi:hypothetical protein DFH09DRAFT_1140832 [Mycena vulgaris]|nr:hypothetical protein DFH09DRAFT_1140832 [Mycena vulgaris]